MFGSLGRLQGSVLVTDELDALGVGELMCGTDEAGTRIITIKWLRN